MLQSGSSISTKYGGEVGFQILDTCRCGGLDVRRLYSRGHGGMACQILGACGCGGKGVSLWSVFPVDFINVCFLRALKRY